MVNQFESVTNFFNNLYLTTTLENIPKIKTDNEVEFIISALGLTKNQSILDLACGQGRHALALAERGFSRVTGIDFTERYIEKAQNSAQIMKKNITFIVNDIRKMAFDAEFDATYNYFTSLFYWDHNTHVAILKSIAKGLKPNGLFLLDMVNPSSLGPSHDPTRAWRTPVNNNSPWILDELILDSTNNQLQINLTYIFPDGAVERYSFFSYLYPLDILIEMFSANGLKIRNIYGATDGRPYTFESPRLILVAQNQCY